MEVIERSISLEAEADHFAYEGLLIWREEICMGEPLDAYYKK